MCRILLRCINSFPLVSHINNRSNSRSGPVCAHIKMLLVSVVNPSTFYCNLHTDLCEYEYFSRPGGATGDAAGTLVGQCAINPFISTSPSLLSASISPLTHHLSSHSSLAVYLSFCLHLLLPREPVCGFVQSSG